MSNADFALQWLDFLGNKIYNKGKQIFVYDGKDPKYEINPYGMLDTKIKYGQKLWDEEEESQDNLKRMSWPEMDELGYAIKSESNPEFMWKPKQKCFYMIIRKVKDSLGLSYDTFRKACQHTNMVIEHDPIHRRFRLKGDSVLAAPELSAAAGVSEWVHYGTEASRAVVYRKEKKISKEEITAMMRQSLYGETVKPEFEYQPIKEIMLVLSDDKQIVCMGREDTCQRIIVVGQSGTGKSVFINGVDDRIFYQWQDRVAWLIDPLNQFDNISLPQDYSEFNKINSWINNPPTPFPAVQLYLASKYPIQITHSNISLLLTLGFVEFVRKIEFYTYGIKEYDLGGTRRYMVDFLDDIRDITNADELRDVMFDKIPNAHKDKGLQSMIYKWTNTFETIFNEGFISNLYKQEKMATDELEIKLRDGTKMRGHPFIMCYEAGVVPVLNIASAKRQRWVRNYLADLMQKIVAHQIDMGKTQRRVWIIADELNDIYELGKKKDNAYTAFEELFRQGRQNNIGFIGNTQSLSKINPEMYDQATHVCCTYIKNHLDRQRIGKTFELDKEIYEQIGELKEQEMMIFSKEPFIVYDRWGRRKVEKKRKWFRGRIIPPMNFHKLPPKRG